MVIKVYVSGISSSPEIRSYQQRSTFILDSLRVDYESVDITDVGNEELKDMIKEKCKHRNDQPPKTPQFFNDDVYCGDWFDFEIASDEDRVLEWLGLEDTREEEQMDLGLSAKEIEGNENIDNENKDTENTGNESIKTEIRNGIVTTETVTKEETIVFSKQNAKTAPINVRLDENGKEVIEFKNLNNETEEESVMMLQRDDLEIIRGDEELISSKVEDKRTEEQEEIEKTEKSENEEKGLENGEDLKEEHEDKADGNGNENESADEVASSDKEDESADEGSMEEE